MTSRRFDRAVPDAGERDTAGRADAARPAPRQAARRDAPAWIPPARATPPDPRVQAAALSRASGGRLTRAGHTLLDLQRQYGNGYVQQVADHAPTATAPSPVLQAKLMVGPPADSYEREADQVARQVIGGATPQAVAGVEGGRVMRTPRIQRASGADAGVVDASVQQAIGGARGGGQPLPGQVRSSMEQAMGADFGAVRVHTDARADQLARSLQARAFTTGQDIFFRRGQDYLSGSGREVLAHELTHVVQQGGGSGQADNLIQRRMGFEFETTVAVRGNFNSQKFYHGTFENDKPFYLSPGGDWKIVPDCGRMEFVTEPLATLAELQAATDEIKKFISGLQGVKRTTNIRPARPGKWIGPPGARDDFGVYVGQGEAVNLEAEVRSHDWYGQPQVSIGVRTERVGQFLRRARTDRLLLPLKGQIAKLISTQKMHPMPASLKKEGVKNLTDVMGSWTARVVKAKRLPEAWLDDADKLLERHAQSVARPDQDKLRGLWTLMRAYWAWLRKSGDVVGTSSYQKSTLAVLARTDFHSFYKDLTPVAQDVFKDARNSFLGQGHDGRVIADTNITLLRWYESISNPEGGSAYESEDGKKRPVDLLSANRSELGEIISAGTDKSMGQYPLDDKGREPSAVFELRALTPGTRIPIALMFDYVVKPIFELVEQVEQ
jgi:hypothetical protein